MKIEMNTPDDAQSALSVAEKLARDGYCPLPAATWSRPSQPGQAEFLASYGGLSQDRHMADGGTYRFRRYSRLLLSRGELSSLDGNSIFQTLEDNPLNGGVERTFEPILPEVLATPFLSALVLQDAAFLNLSPDKQWEVGLHCVRIHATTLQKGQPAPEGIHRDSEDFTVQHVLARQNVQGGVFTAYNEAHEPVFHWLQTEPWDTLFFRGDLWHGVTPLSSQSEGHRDILLVDFCERMVTSG
ncbi:2OG-Fe dioxygenase family protein [bacterium]|nr:2OG-Fe dioxygenase family protein [bacterium]